MDVCGRVLRLVLHRPHVRDRIRPKDLPEASWGRLVALFTAVFAIGQTLGPVAAGAIADATSSLALGLVAAGVVLVVACVVAALQKPIR
jgi:MFS family permease